VIFIALKLKRVYDIAFAQFNRPVNHELPNGLNEKSH